jgi:hypothetical protein
LQLNNNPCRPQTCGKGVAIRVSKGSSDLPVCALVLLQDQVLSSFLEIVDLIAELSDLRFVVHLIFLQLLVPSMLLPGFFFQAVVVGE